MTVAKTSRIVRFALAGLAFAIALYLEMTYVMMFGFWDGFASELDRAENMLAKLRTKPAGSSVAGVSVRQQW